MGWKKNDRIRFLMASSLLFLTMKSHSQNPLLRSKVIFSLSAMGNYCFPAKTVWESGEYHLFTKPALGFEAGFNFTHHLPDNWGLSWGLHGGAVGHNFQFYIPPEDLGYPPNNYNQAGNSVLLSPAIDLIYLSVPLILEKRLAINTHYCIAILGCGNLRYFPLNGSSYAASDEHGEYFNLDINGGNNGKPWMNLNMGAALYKFFNMGGTLKLSLLNNISLKDFAKGFYQITVPNKPLSYGKYSVNSSTFLGMEISFLFTKAPKEIKP